jgi:hypothetical protein
VTYAYGNHFRAQRVYPQLEAWPDISRGEQRLAAEVALAELRGCITPTYAHERAVQILNVLARA